MIAKTKLPLYLSFQWVPRGFTWLNLQEAIHRYQGISIQKHLCLSNMPPRRGGRLESQGYLAAVKKILPLGSWEWGKILDLYNQYATKNDHQSPQDQVLEPGPIQKTHW
ncbi:hypothetical protein VP01_1191g3 [Puccinia sorghi]|uniref:Uncharacterized protein n=1 Tax=Puccinia sorghi TaxID=27349 RepID=A0A0L6VQU9_9BASI|nr:hypothetical protein VP01_1191g3 [Puccinia sorghi]